MNTVSHPIFLHRIVWALLSFALIHSTAAIGQEEEQEEVVATQDGEQDPGRPRVFEGRSGTFEFVAPDAGSLQTARDIARLVFQTCDALITLPEERIPRISIRLVPPGLGNLEEDEAYRIFEDLIGDYGLAVQWSDSLSISLFCDLLTEIYLKQIVFTMADRKRAEDLPAWLIAGASLQVQTKIRPTLVEYLRYLGRSNEMIPLESLMTVEKMADLSFEERVASYWFLQLIQRSIGQRGRIREFYDGVIAGRNALEVLKEQAQNSGRQPDEVEAWWVIGFQDIIHEPTGIVEPIERSRRRYLTLSRFEWIIDGQPMIAGIEDIWEYRRVPVVTETLDIRLRLVENWLPRINPVYYNAYRTLGLAIFSALENDKDGFKEYIAVLEEEIRATVSLDEDIAELISNPDAVLMEAIDWIPDPSPF